MASRRVLVSVADGVARAFSSRNNDVEGWWVPALLLDATAPADPAYRLDLLTGRTIPTTLTAALDDLGPAWARYFSWTLARHGVPPDRVTTADLIVRFGHDELAPWLLLGRTHRPFDCTVRIRDDRGRIYERGAISYCSRLSDFDQSLPPAGRPTRSAPPYDAGRIAQRVGQPTPGDIAAR
jgi:hypothetical protein